MNVPLSEVRSAMSGAALALFIWAPTLSAQTAPDSALEARMTMFAQARQFHDVDALRLFSSGAYIQQLQDTTLARYWRFRVAAPSAVLSSTDPALVQFVDDLAGARDQNLIDAFVAAFAALRRGDGNNAAALAMLAYLYLPPRSWTVEQSEHTFARYEGDKAVYYLTEVWAAPFVEQNLTKRVVVEWFRSGTGEWLLNQLR